MDSLSLEYQIAKTKEEIKSEIERQLTLCRQERCTPTKIVLSRVFYETLCRNVYSPSVGPNSYYKVIEANTYLGLPIEVDEKAGPKTVQVHFA